MKKWILLSPVSIKTMSVMIRINHAILRKPKVVTVNQMNLSLKKEVATLNRLNVQMMMNALNFPINLLVKERQEVAAAHQSAR